MRAEYTVYTKEHIDYLREISKENTNIDIVKKFNKKFGFTKKMGTVNRIRQNNGIKIGITNNSGRFKKGETYPHRKREFKKGKDHVAYRPIGSERIKSGFTAIKTADPDVWEIKHRVIWEKAYGEIPEGHVIVFADGDRQNFDINNLLCMTVGQSLKLHHAGFKSEDAEITKLGLGIIKLEEKIQLRGQLSGRKMY